MNVTLLHAAEGRIRFRVLPEPPRMPEMVRPRRPVYQAEKLGEIYARSHELVGANRAFLGTIAHGALYEAVDRYSALRAVLASIPQLIWRIPFTNGERRDVVFLRHFRPTDSSDIDTLRQVSEIVMPSSEVATRMVYLDVNTPQQAHLLKIATNRIAARMLRYEDKILMELSNAVCDEQGQPDRTFPLRQWRRDWDFAPRVIMTRPSAAKRLRGLPEGCRVFASKAIERPDVMYVFGEGEIGHFRERQGPCMLPVEAPADLAGWVAYEDISTSMFMNAPVRRMRVEGLE